MNLFLGITSRFSKASAAAGFAYACAITVLHLQIAEIVSLMDKWGFCYVENLTWVHMAPNNTVVAAPSLYARRSHLSLFIFRKSGVLSADHTKNQGPLTSMKDVVDNSLSQQHQCSL